MLDIRRNQGSIRLIVVFTASGLIAVVSGIALLSARTVLFALGGTFLFTSGLVYFLTLEDFIQLSISEGIYTDLAANEAALVAEHELQDTLIYIPCSADNRPNNDPPASLFVPQYADYKLPDQDELEPLFVVSTIKRRQGISFRPTGSTIFTEFESMLNGKLSEAPDELAMQLADGLINGLELADSVVPDAYSAENSVTFAIDSDAYEPVDRFDHPLQSFLAVGFAVGLDRPITAETQKTSRDRAEYSITCRWGSNDQTSGDGRLTRGSTRSWPDSWRSKEESDG